MGRVTLRRCSRAGGGRSQGSAFTIARERLVTTAIGEEAGQRHSGADDELERALRMSLEQGYEYLSIGCMSHLTITAGVSGRSIEMVHRAREAIAFASRRGWEKTKMMLPVYVVAAMGAWSCMDDETSERNLAMAESLGGTTEPRLSTYTTLLRAYLQHERIPIVPRQFPILMRRLREIWPRTDESVIGPTGITGLSLIELGYAQEAGDAAWIRETVARAERHLGGTGDLIVIRAWQHLNEGHPLTARAQLASVLGGEVAASMPTLLICWQTECLSAVALDQPERAHAALLSMLDSAAPRFLVRPMAAGPPALLELLRLGKGRASGDMRISWVPSCTPSRPGGLGARSAEMYDR